VDSILGMFVVVLASLVPLAVLLYIVAVAIVLINDQRDPTKTLSWLLLIYILPGLGLVMYFFLGRNFRKKTLRSGWWKRVAETAQPVRDSIVSRYADDIAEGEATAKALGFDEVVRVAEAGESVVSAARLRRAHHAHRERRSSNSSRRTWLRRRSPSTSCTSSGSATS
jgi:hypothetical protein